MELPVSTNLAIGEKRACYRLWEALEEFQSLLLLIQRRNSACKPPMGLRERYEANGGSGRFDHC